MRIRQVMLRGPKQIMIIEVQRINYMRENFNPRNKYFLSPCQMLVNNLCHFMASIPRNLERNFSPLLDEVLTQKRKFVTEE